MYLLFPISCLLLMTAVRYAVSGRSQATPHVLHARFLSSNSTVKVNESIAIGSCPQYILDDRLCALVVGDVDIYFWPDPSRDMSCLSIVGNATRPLMQGASTSTHTFPNNDTYTTVYWGCTARDSTSGESYITTAVLATTGTISVKQYLYNPWSSQPCSAEALPSTSSISQPLEDRGTHASARVRRHALVVSSEITPNGGLLGATATSGNFTLLVSSHVWTHEPKLIVLALLLRFTSTFMKYLCRKYWVQLCVQVFQYQCSLSRRGSYRPLRGRIGTRIWRLLERLRRSISMIFHAPLKA